MCGIAGFVGPGSAKDLDRMLYAIVHRGPDDGGTFVDPETRVFLGARRLAVIDLSGGRQPMVAENGDLVVVFNGEIYNHLELRKDLEAAGCRFATDHSDTEVLLHGYRLWQDALPEKLNGMFAFAIYDKAARRLFLARDRFGEKPLYYAQCPGGIVFGSDLSAVTSHTNVATDFNIMGLQKYFAYGFFPAPSTVFKDVRKLPHGHSLKIDALSGKAVAIPYWRYALHPDPRPRPEGELSEELRSLLSSAVEKRLMSDVPIGIFLSGGLDSSAVAAFAARKIGADRLNTFCLGFDDPSYDESKFARQVAEVIGCRHFETHLCLEHAAEALPGILESLDEPLGDPSILPTYLLCRFARRRVTVALGGDGGDELFAGYDPFLALQPARLYASFIPSAVHLAITKLAERMARSSRYMALDFKLRRALRGLRHRAALWNPVWLSPLEPEEISELLEQPVSAEELYAEAIAAWDESNAKSDIDRSVEFYANFYLPEAVLTKSDRASMMVSLEYRAPFLDKDLVAFACSLPSDMRLRGRERKYILKRSLQGILPKTIIQRRKKGFGIPLTRIVKTDGVPFGDSLSGLLNDEALERLRAQHRSGIKDQRLFLWCLMSLIYFGRQRPSELSAVLK